MLLFTKLVLNRLICFYFNTVCNAIYFYFHRFVLYRIYILMTIGMLPSLSSSLFIYCCVDAHNLNFFMVLRQFVVDYSTSFCLRNRFLHFDCKFNSFINYFSLFLCVLPFLALSCFFLNAKTIEYL